MGSPSESPIRIHSISGGARRARIKPLYYFFFAGAFFSGAFFAGLAGALGLHAIRGTSFQ